MAPCCPGTRTLEAKHCSSAPSLVQLSLKVGCKPQPKADKEVARKAEAALMVPEGTGSRVGWGPEFLFSLQAHLSSPLLLQGRNH